MFEYAGQKVENRSWKEMIELSKKISAENRVRGGKTRKDLKNSCKSRNIANKQAREAWIKETVSLRFGTKPFPEYTARGKGNSSKARKH